jgi:hypothetical protein
MVNITKNNIKRIQIFVQNYLLHFLKFFGIIIIVNEKEITNGFDNNFQKFTIDKSKIKWYNKVYQIEKE